MEQIIGVIQTKPKVEKGRTTFCLFREDDETIISCLSGAGFNCPSVEEKERIKIAGEFKGSPIPFFFYSLEQLKDKSA